MPAPITDPQPIFRSLADPTRRAILMMLAERDLCIGDIADQFAMTRPAIAKHLTVLQEASLISIRQKGRERINRLNPSSLRLVFDWLNYFDNFWDDRLANLKKAVEDDS